MPLWRWRAAEFKEMEFEMNKVGRIVGLVGIALFATINVRAADRGLFVTGSVGANILQDMKFPTAPPVNTVTQSQDIGIRGDATVGYTLFANPSIAVAAAGEIGFIHNSVDKASGGGATVSVDGDFYQVPFLGKVLLTLMPDSRISPWIGAGGGGIYSRLDLRRVGSSFPNVTGDETDPAFQGEAGVNYKLGDKAAIGLVYKFLVGFPKDIGNFYNHSIAVAFTANF